MKSLPRFVRLLALALLVPFAALAQAAETAPLKLRIPVTSDGHANYFVRLLEESLKSIQQPYQIEYVKDIPARRMWSMLGRGDINLFYGMQSTDKRRSKQLVEVRNGLTNGLIGQRVLLIRRSDMDVFARVQSVADLKETGMIAGFGAGWRDATVWKAAGLPLYEHAAPWPTIYGMVAAGNRHIDYLPRGVNEVLEEARQHPELVVEKRLLLVYPGDFAFYLSSSASGYRPVIERALRAAEASGLKARLLEEAFGADLKALNLKRRLRLQLSGPAD